MKLSQLRKIIKEELESIKHDTIKSSVEQTLKDGIIGKDKGEIFFEAWNLAVNSGLTDEDAWKIYSKGDVNIKETAKPSPSLNIIANAQTNLKYYQGLLNKKDFRLYTEQEVLKAIEKAKNIINSDNRNIQEIGGGKNPEADAKVARLITQFQKDLEISGQEAADLIKSSLKRLGY